MGLPVFFYEPEKPIPRMGASDVGEALVEGNKICFIGPFDYNPTTYLCGNSGGLGMEHGASFGNISLILCCIGLIVGSIMLIKRSTKE